MMRRRAFCTALFCFIGIPIKQKYYAHAKAVEDVAYATLLRRENVQSTFFVLLK